MRDPNSLVESSAVDLSFWGDRDDDETRFRLRIERPRRRAAGPRPELPQTLRRCHRALMRERQPFAQRHQLPDVCERSAFPYAQSGQFRERILVKVDSVRQDPPIVGRSATWLSH